MYYNIKIISLTDYSENSVSLVRLFVYLASVFATVLEGCALNC